MLLQNDVFIKAPNENSIKIMILEEKDYLISPYLIALPVFTWCNPKKESQFT
jgi:hypothetical protein